MTDFTTKSLFGEKLLTKTGEVDTTTTLADTEVIGIYFSAHWCPPCRGFTPVFADKYNKLKEAGKKVEVIFASSDQDEAAFTDYFKDMPWLGLPYSDRAKKEELAKKYSCNGIPYLVFQDAKTGETITTNGRGGVSGTSFIEDFPYHPKPMYDISESMDGIANTQSLLIIQDDADKDVQKVNTDWLTQIALDNKDKTDKVVKTFFTANGGGPIGFIKGECRLPVSIGKHEHVLVKKEEMGGWGCDGCHRGGHSCTERYRCSEGCDFDYCEKCIVECEKEQVVSKPSMLIQDVANDKYYDPLEGKTEVNRENVYSFIQDMKDTKIEAKMLASKA